MIEELDGSGILRGYRGIGTVDIESLAEIIVRLSDALVENPAISELDVNPLICTPFGITAVDASALLAPVTPESLSPRKAVRNRKNDIAGFFGPRSVAVISASAAQGRTGTIIISNLLEFGFRGDIYPVFPRGGEVLGLKAYRSIAEVNAKIDLGILAMPAEKTMSFLEECGRASMKRLIIVSAGFSDIGDAGRKREQELVSRARELGIRIMGPNSIGTISPTTGLCTSITTLKKIKPGGCSLFGQTGVFSSGFASWIESTQNFGVARIACIGNKADVEESELIEYLADDPETAVIGLYTEGFSRGPDFIAAARKTSARKPVVVLKSGRSAEGREAVASHTGSLAGNDAIYDAAFRKAGIVRVRDFEEFFDALKAFGMAPALDGPRLGVVSISGVGCVLTADCVKEHGLELPPLTEAALEDIRGIAPDWAPLKNPVDMWTTIDRRGASFAYSAIADALLRDETYDALLVIFVLVPESPLEIEEVFAPLKERYRDKPIAAAFLGGDEENVKSCTRALENLDIPCYPSPNRAVRALGHLFAYDRYRRV